MAQSPQGPSPAMVQPSSSARWSELRALLAHGGEVHTCARWRPPPGLWFRVFQAPTKGVLVTPTASFLTQHLTQLSRLRLGWSVSRDLRNKRAGEVRAPRAPWASGCRARGLRGHGVRPFPFGPKPEPRGVHPFRSADPSPAGARASGLLPRIPAPPFAFQPQFPRLAKGQEDSGEKEGHRAPPGAQGAREPAGLGGHRTACSRSPLRGSHPDSPRRSGPLWLLKCPADRERRHKETFFQ